MDYLSNLLIGKANTTVVIDLFDGSILEVSTNFQPSNYSVNISELFQAYTAPLTYTPVNVSRLLTIDYLPSRAAVNSFDPIFLHDLNASSSKAVIDQYVDFLVYTFTTPLPDESPAEDSSVMLWLGTRDYFTASSREYKADRPTFFVSFPSLFGSISVSIFSSWR